MAGHKDYFDAGVLVKHALEKIHARQDGHHQINQDYAGSNALECFQASLGIGRRMNFQTGVGQSVLDQSQSRDIIVDGEEWDGRVAFGHRLSSRATGSFSGERTYQ
jgi:hypothetical protein